MVYHRYYVKTIGSRCVIFPPDSTMQKAEGLLFIDPITLRPDDVPTVIARLQEILQPVGATTA